MFKISIKKQNIETHGAKFETLAEANAWIKECESIQAWGLPERWLQDTPLSPLSEQQKAQALETRTVEVIGGQVIEYKMPAEYTVEIQDITAEVEAEKLAKEAKEKAKAERKQARKAIDWAKINSIAELKAIVKNLVEELD